MILKFVNLLTDRSIKEKEPDICKNGNGIWSTSIWYDRYILSCLSVLNRGCIKYYAMLYYVVVGTLTRDLAPHRFIYSMAIIVIWYYYTRLFLSKISVTLLWIFWWTWHKYWYSKLKFSDHSLHCHFIFHFCFHFVFILFFTLFFISIHFIFHFIFHFVFILFSFYSLLYFSFHFSFCFSFSDPSSKIDQSAVKYLLHI